ncbi:MAG: hypothetical protein KC609_14430, partial [Myxococcales bacterium]|nr:hypothetical protein [Myxococcales bacterium]
QIAEWRARPFQPHAIARLRQTAYMKRVFMTYVDILIEWGDQLFRRDTMESTNEATQLYLLAAQLLGPRPQRVALEAAAPRTFNQLLATGFDQLSNSLVEELEGYLPETIVPVGEPALVQDDLPILGPTLFFCVPPNETLISEYWDRVADRLFKLRHCMNIEGVVRELPLFEPPIDPALLVRAAAAGLDLASALSEVDAPLPHYRFQLMAQKATELCGDVRALGQALLAALEKRDAEQLALVRTSHEVTLYDSVIEVRKKQIDEAKQALESLKRSRENAEHRLAYYQSRTFTNPSEASQLSLLDEAGYYNGLSGAANLLATELGAFPNVAVGIAGFGGSPNVTASYGGAQVANVLRAVAEGARLEASQLDRAAQMAAILGSYERRRDEWRLQAEVVQKEIGALDKQILGAEIRVAIAANELENTRRQLTQAKDVESFLRDKFTNVELYHYMLNQLSSLYFQSYKLAYDLAKRAERAFEFELAVSGRGFIQFGYWDGLKKGLLAG